jgi:single-strand DNA-binding protein
MRVVFFAQALSLPPQVKYGLLKGISAGLRVRLTAIIFFNLKIHFMEFIGRLTADARVSETKTGKQVTNFTVALNDSYRAAATGERVQVTAFIRCSYWLNSKVAEWLKKGDVVSVQGRIGMETYKDKQGEAAGNITCHVNRLNIYSNKAQDKDAGKVKKQQSEPENKQQDEDDLPF